MQTQPPADAAGPHHCPICQRALPVVARYPNYVCATCAARATARDGRRLRFGNTHPSGGFAACYADTHESYDRHECFIDGVPCRADEARFGGIVVEVV